MIPATADLTHRWRIRARIDAMIARSYRLNRDQYAHLLNSFSHRSFPAAPDLCLAAFDKVRLTRASGSLEKALRSA